MRLLFDQNLTRRRVARLAVEYPDSAHVADLNLDTAADRTIWEYAGTHNSVIASKDTDFRQLAFLFGPPPKVIWRLLPRRARTRISMLWGGAADPCLRRETHRARSGVDSEPPADRRHIAVPPVSGLPGRDRLVR